MKKFLLIFLIAVTASVTIDFDDAELNGYIKSTPLDGPKTKKKKHGIPLKKFLKNS